MAKKFNERHIEIIQSMVQLVVDMPTGTDELLNCDFDEWAKFRQTLEEIADE